MASFSERATIYIETKVDNATTGLKNLKSSVQDAEGATGKLKAATSGLGDVVSSAAGALLSPAGLAAGAAAVGGAAVKAVGAFEDLGLTIGKVRDSTGLTADAASRWVEVADDAGVSTESFTKNVGFMEKAIGTNKEAFTEWGVEVVKAKDGTTDVNATLLNAIQTINAIEDPVKKNAAGLAIFGKGWKDMSELIGEGSVKLKSDLASVQASKVFTDADIGTARDVRDGFDAIKDAGEGLFLTLGKGLAPAVAELSPLLADLVDEVGPLAEGIGSGLAGALKAVAPLLKGLSVVLGPVLKVFGAVGDALGGAVENFSHLSSGVDKSSAAITDAMPIIKKYGITADGAMHYAEQLGLTHEQMMQAFRDSGGNMLTAIQNMYALGPATKATAAETDRLTAAAQAYFQTQTDLAHGNTATAASMQELANAAIHADDALAEAAVAADHAAQRETDMQTAMDLAAVATATATKDINAHIQALQDDADALNKQSDAFGNTADAQITYNKGLADFKTKSKDAKAGADDVRDAAIGASKAHAALYESMVTSAGGVATATGKLDAQNATLLETARTATGPAKQGIIEYIATLNGISAEKATEIVANANTAQAEQDLKDVSRNRALTVTAEAETAQAQKDINTLIANNAGKSFGIKIIPGFGAKQANGGTTPQGGGIAGEAGAEFITLPDGRTMLLTSATPVPPGTRVTSVRKTREILNRRRPRYANGTQLAADTVGVSSSPVTFVYEQNAPVYGVEDLNRHLEQWSRSVAAKISVGRRS